MRGERFLPTIRGPLAGLQTSQRVSLGEIPVRSSVWSMKQVRQHDRVRSTRWLAWTVVLAVLGTGCAGGSWLESPSDAELPLDPPARNYPTAIRAAVAPAFTRATHEVARAPSPETVMQRIAVPEPSVEPDRPNLAAGEAIQATSSESTKRVENPSPPLPRLAVVPAPFRSHPTTDRAPLPAPRTTSAQQPAADSASNQPAVALATLADAEAGLAPIVPASAMPSRPAPLLAPGTESVSTAPATAAIAAVAPMSAQTSPVDRDARIGAARAELIAALEASVRQHRSEILSDEELPRLEQELRLAYLLAGRHDDAVAAVESLDSSQRETYKHLMFSLGVWISPDESRRAPLRTAKVLRSLREATTQLAAGSKLELRKLAFCERVEYFGWYTEFPRYEFQPKQEVILYVEVDNFSAVHKPPAGYETELHGRYEIFDATTGQVVAARQLPPDKEVCRNYRRDYFLRYRIYMPDSIPPGRYRLELTIEDQKAPDKYPGRKSGEGMIEFSIRQ